jgi:acyl carrier protein
LKTIAVEVPTMPLDLDNAESRVLRIVAEALDQDPAELRLQSSLIDDLGAASVDFVDIRCRLEAEFGIEIADADLWRGNLDLDDPRAFDGERVTAAGMEDLRRRRPRFPWSRFGGTVRRDDLPRLITVATILDYLSRRAGNG